MGRWQRAVGVFVFGIATVCALLLLLIVTVTNSRPSPATTQQLLLGDWRVPFDTKAPPIGILLGAVGIALACAAGLAWIERRVASSARRSGDAAAHPLAPRLVMARTRGVFAGPITVTVLIPAHNEQDCIAQTLTSLSDQSVPPHRVIVVADNCTDDTIAIARAAGAEVFSSLDNTHKKAGALNQALHALLPICRDNDLIMVMDADTTLDAGFLETAVKRMKDDRALMAVGGLFYGEEGFGVLGQFQRNEYHRYQRDIKRRRGRPFVLTGTATLFRAPALQQVAALRGRSVPGQPGQVYDTASLTEDNELTLALKTLGALIISPPQCTVVTEVMPTWKGLWAQRLRWQRGALENLGAYGYRPSTIRNWSQQLGIGYGVIALFACLIMMAIMAVAIDHWVWFTFWLITGAVFMLERVVTVWRGGWRARIIAAMVLPELAYAVFLDLVFLKGILDISFDRRAKWTHVVQGADGRLEVHQ